MTKQFRFFLLLTGGVPLAVVVLACLNFLIICRLLHIDEDPLAKIQSQAIPVSEPLVLASSPEMTKAALGLIRKMVGSNAVARVPGRHPLLIEDSWVRRANPYPPLLTDIASEQLYKSPYFSFGYMGKNGRYCQITYISGEADTLPSLLVRKVRGEMTLGGDYFLSYAFLLSREPRLVDVNGRPTYPQIDAVEWGSYRGGSYNGFEELFFNAGAILFELCLLIIGLIVVSKYRSFRRAA